VDPLVTTSQPELGKSRLGVKLCVARMPSPRWMASPSRPAARSGTHRPWPPAQGHGMLIGYLSATRIVVHHRAPRCGPRSWTVASHRIVRRGAATASPIAPRPMRSSPSAASRFFALETIELFFDKAQEEAALAGRRQGAAPRPAIVPRDEQVRQANRFFDAAATLLADDPGQPPEPAQQRSRRCWPSAISRSRRTSPCSPCCPRRRSRRADVYAMQHAGTRAMLALEVFRGEPQPGITQSPSKS